MPASDVEGYVLGYRFNSANYVSDEFVDLSGYGGPVTNKSGTPTFETKNGHEGVLLDNTWHGEFFHPNAWQGTMVAVIRVELLTSGTHTTYPIIFDDDGATGNTGRLAVQFFSGQRNLTLNSIGALGTPTQNLSTAINVVGAFHDQEIRKRGSQLDLGSASISSAVATSIDGHDMAMGSTVNGAIIGAVTGSSASTTLETDHEVHLFALYFFEHNPMVNDATAFTAFMAELVETYGPAPTANGTLDDKVFVQNAGVKLYDISGAFNNASSYSLISPPTGVTIDSATGIISTDTDALSLQTATTITVRGINLAGTLDRTYDFDVIASQGALQDLANTTFIGGRTGVLVDPAQNTFEETASQTTAAGNTDPVGSVVSLDPSTNIVAAPADGQRPTLTESGGITYFEFSANDRLNLVDPTASTVHTAAFAYRTTATGGVLLNSDDVGEWAGVYVDGATSTDFSSGTDTAPTYTIDGASPADRDAAHTAIAGGGWVYVLLEDIDPSSDWAYLAVGDYAGGLAPDFELGPIMVIETAGGNPLQAAEKNDIETAIMGAVGV